MKLEGSNQNTLRNRSPNTVTHRANLQQGMKNKVEKKFAHGSESISQRVESGISLLATEAFKNQPSALSEEKNPKVLLLPSRRYRRDQTFELHACIQRNQGICKFWKFETISLKRRKSN